MVTRLLNSQTKTVSGAAIVLAISAILSGFLGLIRDRLLASTFGAGIETSIYFAAFRIPDLVYNILILGGILVAFLPIFSDYFAESKEKAWEMVNSVLNVFLALLVAICLVLFIFTPWLAKFVAPGFTPEQSSMVISLTRLLFLSPILFGAASIFSAILHYFNKFLAYSIAPLLYNLGIIFGIIFLAPRFGILGVGMGVIFGAFLYLLVQFFSVLSCGFHYRPLFDFQHPAVKRIFMLMIPRIFGVVSNQVNLIVITAIASTISVGSIAIFNFSNNIQGLPVTILGISLATAIFPTFSRLWVNGQKKEFSTRFSSSFRQTLFLVIPVSILMFFLRAQIVRLILGTGRFDWEDTRLTAASLGLFALSIFASALIPFVARAFFSFKDTKTPAVITLFSVSVNAFLGILFVQFLRTSNSFTLFVENNLKIQNIQNISMIGLPLAFSIATVLQLVFLLVFLYKRIGDFGVKEIANSLKKILFAGFLMSVFVYFTLQLVSGFVDMQTFIGVFIQALISGLIGLGVYLAVSRLLSSKELESIQSSVFKKLAEAGSSLNKLV